MIIQENISHRDTGEPHYIGEGVDYYAKIIHHKFPVSVGGNGTKNVEEKELCEISGLDLVDAYKDRHCELNERN